MENQQLFGGMFSWPRQLTQRRHQDGSLFQRWYVLLASLIVAGAILLSVGSYATASAWQQYQALSISSQPIASTTPKAVTTPTATPTASTSSAAPTPQANNTAAPVVSVIQDCAPGAKTNPSALDLTLAASGVTQQIDSPTQYQIYGNSMSDLTQQIQRCSPAGSTNGGPAEYTAQTNFNLSWRYDYQTQGSICTITNVKVGLHVTMDMPLWQPTATAQNGLPTAWSSFVKNLKTHEDGHTVISQQQAQAMLSDLQSIGSTSCTTLTQTVQQITDTRMATLSQAQATYDAQTNHGATQGAILPR